MTYNFIAITYQFFSENYANGYLLPAVFDARKVPFMGALVVSPLARKSECGSSQKLSSYRNTQLAPL